MLPDALPPSKVDLGNLFAEWEKPPNSLLESVVRGA